MNRSIGRAQPQLAMLGLLEKSHARRTRRSGAGGKGALEVLGQVQQVPLVVPEDVWAPRYTRCFSLVVRVQCSQRTASSMPCVHPTSPHIHPYRHSYIHTYHGTMYASARQGQSRMHGYAGQPLMKFHWINSGCPRAKNSASPRLPFPGDISRAASRSYSRSLVCLILGC